MEDHEAMIVNKWFSYDEDVLQRAQTNGVEVTYELTFFAGAIALHVLQIEIGQIQDRAERSRLFDQLHGEIQYAMDTLTARAVMRRSIKNTDAPLFAQYQYPG